MEELQRRFQGLVCQIVHRLVFTIHLVPITGIEMRMATFLDVVRVIRHVKQVRKTCYFSTSKVIDQNIYSIHFGDLIHIHLYYTDFPFVKMAPGEPCPSGTEITTESRCREAEEGKLALGLNPGRNFESGGWSGVPYGCSAHCCGGGIYNDDTFHFSSNSLSDNSRQSEFVRICENNK